MTPITFVLFKWRPEFVLSPRYTSADVNRLAAQILSNYGGQGRVVCYTDDECGIVAPTEVRPLWPDTKPLIAHDIQFWKWTHARVLRMFSREEGEALGGGRICHMDLDIAITGDMMPFMDRPEDFVLTRSPAPTQSYNTQVVLFDAGARPQLWDEFEGDASLPRIKACGEPPVTSGWVGTCLGPDEAVFPADVPWRHGRNTMRVAA
jgi:hypothetical protein